MITVDISIGRGFDADREKIHRSVVQALTQNGIEDAAEVSVVVCGSQKMKELHRQYMETYEETDVLSFPLEEAPAPDGIRYLGDVVVCYPVAQRQAIENNRSVDDEIDFLVDHGCKHLMGIHHE